MININFGGCGCLFGIIVVVVLLGFILFVVLLIEMIFFVVFVGVMFVVVIVIFEWVLFRIICGVNKEDVFVFFLVIGVIVIVDLVIVVVVGVIVFVLVFVWKYVCYIEVRFYIDNDGWKVYELDGLLFFGLVLYFKDLFDIVNDFNDVVIDFKDFCIWDLLGIDVLDIFVDKYEE